ncbi:MAG: hypothetical protein H5T69_14115 [Chloroflexi bacterium]|nr:hypothetical protein [Chloroflexota bacterium]
MERTRHALALFLHRGRLRDRQAAMRLDGRTLAYFAAMLALIGLAGWLYLHQASEVAAYAHEIRQLEERKEALHRELIALRGQVAMLDSLERAHKIGQQAGYRLPTVAERERQFRLRYIPPQKVPTEMAQAQSVDRESTVRRLDFFEGLVKQLTAWLETTDADASR